MKVEQVKIEAATLIAGGLSIEQVAEQTGTCYRTARKAINMGGTELRDPSKRLIGRTRPDKRASVKAMEFGGDRSSRPGREAGRVELTDQQWLEVRKVAESKAMQMTRGDVARSEDIASIVIEKLLVRDIQVQPGRLNAYVREMVKNTYLDQKAKQNAAYRGGPSRARPMDEDLERLFKEVGGVFKRGLLTSGPSAKVIRRERQDARLAAYQQILASLPEKKQRLVRMAAEGYSHRDIAEELGYANAGVVTTSLHRVYRDIREQFDLRYADYFSQTSF
jgi:RNA polymerase sigma factor (sigma-70 family)